MRYTLILITFLMSFSTFAAAQNEPENRPALTEAEQQQALDKLQEPMYKPLLERYILDELKEKLLEYDRSVSLMDKEHIQHSSTNNQSKQTKKKSNFAVSKRMKV